jgi:hypothetical protein
MSDLVPAVIASMGAGCLLFTALDCVRAANIILRRRASRREP